MLCTEKRANVTVYNFTSSIYLISTRAHTFTGAIANGALSAGYGVGRGPILFDQVQCVGTEDSLFDCPSSGLGVHSCPTDHSLDAGAICSSGSKLIKIAPYSTCN